MQSQKQHEIFVESDLPSLSQKGAEIFIREAKKALNANQKFNVTLSGGSTPRKLYELLAKPPYLLSISWEGVHFFWGDERCVQPNHPESNYRMFREAFLSRVSLPRENIHRIRAEMQPEKAASEYENELKKFFGQPEFPRFNLALMGLGTDGHTASLFPETKVLQEKRRWVAAQHVDKLKANRITLTVPVFNQAEAVIFLVSGEDKAEILPQILEGPANPERFPAQFIRPANGRLVWVVDEAAAKNLRPS